MPKFPPKFTLRLPDEKERLSLVVKPHRYNLSTLPGKTPKCGFERWMVGQLWKAAGCSIHWSDIEREWRRHRNIRVRCASWRESWLREIVVAAVHSEVVVLYVDGKEWRP